MAWQRARYLRGALKGRTLWVHGPPIESTLETEDVYESADGKPRRLIFTNLIGNGMLATAELDELEQMSGPCDFREDIDPVPIEFWLPTGRGARRRARRLVA